MPPRATLITRTSGPARMLARREGRRVAGWRGNRRHPTTDRVGSVSDIARSTAGVLFTSKNGTTRFDWQKSQSRLGADDEFGRPSTVLRLPGDPRPRATRTKSPRAGRVLR